MGRSRRIVSAALILLAAAPVTAHADSIVFRRGGDVWQMAPDGTGQRQITHEGRYEWPSAADDGTILAADTAGALHRFSPAGAEIGVIPTASTVATDDEPSETPTHVRISPDGTRIAYDQAIDGDVTTVVTAADATAPVVTGQDGLVAPSWIGNAKLLLSRDISFADEGAAFWLHTLGGATASWFDAGAPWATGFDAAASRSGARVAVLANDAAETGGTPSRVALRLFAGTEFRCEFAAEAAETYDAASPSFSPDGTRLAWAASDGIHVATLGALDDCAAVREQVITLPGAWEPYWTAADLPAAAMRAPRLTLSVRVRARPHRLTVRKRGIAVRVTASAPTTVRVTIGARRVTRRFAHAGTATIRVRPRAAKRYVVRVSAPGAPTVTATVRPR